MPRDRIRIIELNVECIIGVLPEERRATQPVILDLELGIDLSPAGRSGRISDTVDYSRVAAEVRSLLEFRRYRLLEAAAEEIAAMLLGTHRTCDDLAIALRKPRALPGATAAAVTIERGQADYRRELEDTSWGQAEILLETREAGLYLLHVDAGLEIPSHRHEVMRELEWLLHGEVWREGHPVAPFAPVTWRRGEVHSYQNRGTDRATLFCCDCPPFIPTDEIPVAAQAGAGK